MTYSAVRFSRNPGPGPARVHPSGHINPLGQSALVVPPPHIAPGLTPQPRGYVIVVYRVCCPVEHIRCQEGREHKRGMMAGRFEILWEAGTGFLFHLTGGEGAVLAVSRPFATIQDIKAGVEAVRENAATGLVVLHPTSKPMLCPSAGHEGSMSSLEVDIVDGHGMIRECLAGWLEENTEGIRVVGSFSSWAELVPSLDALSDVVIMEVLLGDNTSLTARIQTILAAGHQVVVCSSVTNPAVMRQAFEAGALSYVPKTAPAAVLEAALRAAAAGQAHVTEEVAAAVAVDEPKPKLAPGNLR